MRLDAAHVDRAADERSEWSIRGVRIDHKQPAIAEVANSRDEPVAEQMEHCEHRLGCACGVGRMLVDLDRAFVVDKPIEHIGRFAFGGLDEPGEEGGEPVGEEAVDRGAGPFPIFGVVVEAGFAAAPSGKELPIGGGHMTVPPDRREGVGLLGIDQHRSRCGIGFGAKMAIDHQNHLVDCAAS